MAIELTPDLLAIAAGTRVLRDRALVMPVPYMHPVLATPGVEVQKGIVIAVGYGRRQRRKVEFKQDMGGQEMYRPDGTKMKFAQTASAGRTLSFEDGPETGRILPMQVKPGDLVEFSFRNSTPVPFDRISEFKHLGVGTLLFVFQNAMYFIDNEPDLEKACAETLLWQQSAGYDRNGNWMSGAEDWHRA